MSEHQREYGEIGRHKGFKIPRFIACRFESDYSHINVKERIPMRYIKINQGPNRSERRAASRHAHRLEKTNKNSKRMNRPERMDMVNAGYEKLMNFFFPA